MEGHASAAARALRGPEPSRDPQTQATLGSTWLVSVDLTTTHDAGPPAGVGGTLCST